jgi:hypothetical protein
LCLRFGGRLQDAERFGLHYHAERGNDQHYHEERGNDQATIKRQRLNWRLPG